MADGPFLMILATLADDHPKVWTDRALLWAYVHCAMTANAFHPAPFTIPREVTDDEVAALSADGILDEVGAGRYTFHGLAKLRGAMESRGKHGGLIRAATGPRDDSGRYVPTLVNGAGADAGRSRSDAGNDAGRNAGPPSSVAKTLGVQRSTQESREDETRGRATTSRASSRDSESTVAPVRATADPRGVSPDPAGIGVARSDVGGGRYGTPNVPSCLDPVAHGSDWRYYVGVGWKCLTCDAEGPGDRSFREKARDHGAAF